MTLDDVGSRGLYLLGLSPRLEVVLLCWELCLVRRDEAESPGELSALGWEQQRPLSRVAGSQDRSGMRGPGALQEPPPTSELAGAPAFPSLWRE